MQNNFQIFFEKELYPKLIEIEKVRQNSLILLLIFLVFLLILLYLQYNLNFIDCDTRYLMLFSVLLVSIVFYFSNQRFVEYLNKMCVPLIAQCFSEPNLYSTSVISEDEYYESIAEGRIITDKISYGMYRNSIILGDSDIFESDINIIGQNKGVDIAISNAKLYYTNKYGNKIPFSVFQGQLVRYGLDLPLYSEVIIGTDVSNIFYKKRVVTIVQIMFYIFAIIGLLGLSIACLTCGSLVGILALLPIIPIIGIISCSFKDKDHIAKYNKLQNKITNLQSKFDIYAEDVDEANSIIEPTFIEKLLAIKTFFKSKDIRCSLHHKQVTLVLPKNKNFQSPNVFTNLINVNNAYSYFSNIIHKFELIIDFSEYLSKYNNINT